MGLVFLLLSPLYGDLSRDWSLSCVFSLSVRHTQAQVVALSLPGYAAQDFIFLRLGLNALEYFT